MTVALALLAAGRSSRMGAGRHKLLACFDGVPLIRRSALAALGSGASPVVLVLGHRAEELYPHLAGLSVATIVNDSFDTGLSSSLRAALAEVPALATGLLVQLADMPGITSKDLRRLIEAFETCQGKAILRATASGAAGNPVILPRSLFAAIERLQGDIGARTLIERSGLPVVDVELGRAACVDVDTPAALKAAGGVWLD